MNQLDESPKACHSAALERLGLVGPKIAFFHMMRLILIKLVFFLRSATRIIIFLTYSIVFLSENDIVYSYKHSRFPRAYQLDQLTQGAS